MERAFKMKQKEFFIILKGLSLKQIKQIFLEGENPTLTPITFHVINFEIPFFSRRLCFSISF